MQAVFVIGTGPQTALDEAAALAAVAASQLPDIDHGLQGRIVLEAPDQPRVALQDDLEFLVPKLCLQAPAQLAAQGEATLTMASWPGRFVLRSDGTSVQLFDAEDVALGRFVQADLALALAGCAQRFTAYIGMLAAQDEAWAPLHQALSRRLAAGS